MAIYNEVIIIHLCKILYEKRQDEIYLLYNYILLQMCYFGNIYNDTSCIFIVLNKIIIEKLRFGTKFKFVDMFLKR